MKDYEIAIRKERIRPLAAIRLDLPDGVDLELMKWRYRRPLILGAVEKGLVGVGRVPD
jgi:hypothetical protein